MNEVVVLTPERILEVTEDVLRRFGIAKATVVDVARALDVSHGSVYRHFPSKASLREAVAKRWLARVSAPLDGIAPLFLIDRPLEFEPIRQHDHGLGAALAFIHRKPDRLGAVYEQAAAKASGVLDDP